MKHSAKRLGNKRYLYRGFIIQGHGYHTPDHSQVWEVEDHDDKTGCPNGTAFGHSFTLRDAKYEVDYEIERLINK
jgi:hypothetical protein